jgi:hypothetical protein
MLLILDCKNSEFYKIVAIGFSKKFVKAPIHAMIKPLIKLFFIAKCL